MAAGHITPKEASERWGYTETTIRGWCKEGLLSVVCCTEKIDGRWKISENAKCPKPIKNRNEEKKMKTTKRIGWICCLMAALLLSGCACSHDFGEWKTTTAATCTTDGVEQRSCTKCEESEERAVPALTHTFGNWTVKTAATCTAEGVDHKICSRCNATEEKKTPMVEHTFGGLAKITKQPTCVETGIKQLGCLNCDAKEEAVIEKVAHSYDSGKVTKAATCTAEGVKTYTCQTCSDTKTEPIKMKAHSYDSGNVTSAATCTTTGVKTITCKNCGATKTETIAKLAHSYDAGTVTKEATCTTDGTKTVSCTSCGNTKTDKISKTGHSYDSGKITQDASCTTAGTKTITCASCGDTKTETIKKLGHAYGDDLICTRCKEVGSLESIMTSSEKKDADKVYWRSGISVNHDDQKKEFKITFTFQDKNETTYLKAPAVVEITIVNDDNETVYSANKILRASDYNGSQAVVKIKDSEIKGGKNTYGEISIKVYNTGYFSFDANTSRIYGELPLEGIKVQLPALPQTIHEYDYKNNIESSVKITNITYELYNDDSVKFYVTGEKLYDAEGKGHSSSTKIGWKLYDSEGYIIDSGTFYSPGIKMGEKFKNEDFRSYDQVTPGGSYRLEILNVS